MRLRSGGGQGGAVGIEYTDYQKDKEEVALDEDLADQRGKLQQACTAPAPRLQRARKIPSLVIIPSLLMTPSLRITPSQLITPSLLVTPSPAITPHQGLQRAHQ